MSVLLTTGCDPTAWRPRSCAGLWRKTSVILERVVFDDDVAIAIDAAAANGKPYDAAFRKAVGVTPAQFRARKAHPVS